MNAASKRNSERGAVVVMVAVWLPVLALFASFAIDISHFFVYSRNLQNRADAAALAAGDEYGGACFGVDANGNSTYTTAQTDPIGKAAQQYAGPPVEDPSNPYTVPTNLPYPYSTFAQNQYKNVPNLTKGTPPNYHLLLNSKKNWGAGGQDWSMGNGVNDSTALCNSIDEDGKTGAMADVRITQSNLGLFFPLLGFTPSISAHARVSLVGIEGENGVIPIAVRDPAAIQCVDANFFDDTGKGNGSATLLPGSPVHMTSEGTDATTGGTIWDIPAGTAVPMPANGDNVFVQIVTGPCGDNPSTYDATSNGNTNSGLIYINSWSTGSVLNGQAPKLTAGGVNLTGICPNDGLSNQYFTNAACGVGVTAHVSFAPNVPYPAETVTAADTSGNGGPAITLSKLSTQVNGNQTVAAGGLLQVTSTANFAPSGSIDNNGATNGNGTVTSFAYSAIVDATHFRLTAGGTFKNNDVITQTGDTTWTSTLTPGNPTFGVQPGSGQHLISVTAKQTAQSIGSQNCATGGGCTTLFGVQQQAFGSCNDQILSTCSNPPNDSGPIELVQLRLKTDSDGIYGRNAFAAGNPTPLLNVKIELAGLSNAKPGDKPTILRFNEGGNNGFVSHATGLLNCGQSTSGTGSAILAIAFGCPVAGSPDCPSTNKFFDYCAPFAINHRNSVCPDYPPGTLAGSLIPPATTPSYRTAQDPTVPVDCIETLGGGKSPVPQGVACRIFTSMLLSTCANSGNPGGQTCSANNWSKTIGASSVPANDPRAVSMVITAPEDLSLNNGPPVPIRNFATFYIVGWNTQGGTGSCSGYDPTDPGAASDAYQKNQCTDGAPEPCITTGPQSKRTDGQPGEIWGYWIKYDNGGGIPSQTTCKVNAFGDCVPALTR